MNTREVLEHAPRNVAIKDSLEFVEDKLMVRAGQLAEPLLSIGIDPKTDETVHKTLVVIAHIQEVKEFWDKIHKA